MTIAPDANKAINLRYRVALSAVVGFSVLLVFVAAQMYGGKTWDEDTHVVGLQQQIQIAKFIFAGDFSHHYSDVMHPDLAHYGGLPVFPAYFLYSVTLELVHFADPQKTGDLILAWLLHANAYLYAVLTCVLVYCLVYRLTTDRRPAALCAILLYLYPSWLGHAFFNFKDMPTAFFFILAVFCSVQIINPKDDRDFRIGSYGIAIATIGLVGVKLIAAGLIAPAWLVYANKSIHRPTFFLSMVLVTLLGAYVVTPQAWLDPIHYPIENVIYMSRHPWAGCTLTFSKCVRTHAASWSAAKYLAEWLIVRLPLLLIIASPVAAVIFALGTPARKLVVASLVFPFALIVGRNSTLYDGIRHILFAIPFLFVMTAVILYDLSQRNKYWHRSLATLTAFYIATFTIDNVWLFPYNYVYFNVFGRQVADKNTFDLDYWVFSSREVASVAGRLHDAQPNTPITISPTWISVVTPFLRPGVSVIYRPHLDPKFKGTYYSILFNRGTFVQGVGCKKIDSISRSLPFTSKALELVDISACQKGD